MSTNFHKYSSNIKHESRMFKEIISFAKANIADEIILVGIGDGDLPEFEELDRIRRIWIFPNDSLHTYGLPKSKIRSIIRYIYTFVVSESTSDWYRTNNNLNNVTTVRNYPELASESNILKSDILRDKYRIQPEDIIFLYQGILFNGRAIEI